MTSTTDSLASVPEAAPLSAARGPSRRVRFGMAFAIGLVVALAAGAGAIYAYGASFGDRILPGVRVGTVDVGGLDRSAAAAKLGQAYADLGRGSIVLADPDGELTVGYDEIARRPDIDAMVADALAVGRSGSPLERTVAEAQTALRGVSLAPRVVLDADRLSARVASLVGPLQRPSVPASVRVTKTGFQVTESQTGRSIDAEPLARAVVAALGSLAAGPSIRVEVPVVSLAPAVTNEAAMAGRAEAERMAVDLKLTAAKEHWTISASAIRSWIWFAATPDGRYQPTLDTTKVSAALKSVARKANQSPKNATFLTGKGGAIVGVAAGRDGRAVDVKATAALVSQALNSRAGGTATPAVELTFTTKKPTFTTDDARKTAPLMRKISTWTTYFPISDHNGFGANIWIPASIIDGTVVGPGETFDFWQAVGPVTRAKGYKDGGAIIDGHTEPQGALAGGICSCSTTLFNAALRAGFEMHARKNHFYYIDRYPLGLDATVFISASGAKQTMSWRNDTSYPVLIRGYRIKDGLRGYVRFDLYSVPNGRKVVISAPVVKNVQHATDTVQRTSSLPAGTTKRVEYPVDGKDVWRTVTVYLNGKVIHRTTYYSHYSRITGVLLVGTGGSASPSTSPSPSP